MVRWPNRIAPGRSSTLVSLADILPTFVALAKGTVPRDLDGQNILSVWEGRSQEGHDFVYGVGESQGIQDRSLFPQRSISDGRYNYIYNFNSMERLKRDQKAGLRLTISGRVMHGDLLIGPRRSYMTWRAIRMSLPT